MDEPANDGLTAAALGLILLGTWDACGMPVHGRYFPPATGIARTVL